MSYYPTLYEVNLRVVLTTLTEGLGRHATMDDVPDETLADWATKGFDWIWLMGVWQTGTAARTISRENAALRKELQKTLPDIVDGDIIGSGFAVQDYHISRELGGNKGLARLRARMKTHGLKLMLDFVPNHLAPDHKWVNEHPEYFVLGTEDDLVLQPQNFRRIQTPNGSRIFALGRDPYFPGWIDTLQLNFGNLALQHAMLGELQRISRSCDGVRCDMAMLVLPAVFKRTWGIESQAFWPSAIRMARELDPNFLFMAEVYWELEWELQQQGFDYCYDKRLYDRLRSWEAGPVQRHLAAGLDFQNRLVRFLENHDEPRAAKVFPLARHLAAAVITYMTPGLRFFHQGQLEGHLKHISPHVVRSPVEQVDHAIEGFYLKLLEVLQLPILKEGKWRLLNPKRIEAEDGSHENLIAFQWDHDHSSILIVAVNYSAERSRASIQIQPELGCMSKDHFEYLFEDLFDSAVNIKEGIRLNEDELIIDLPAWGVQVLMRR